MNKLDLVKKMAESSGLSQTACKKALEAFIQITKQTVKAHDSITLSKFGTFLASHRSSRRYVKPLTLEEYIAPACAIFKFRPSLKFRKV